MDSRHQSPFFWRKSPWWPHLVLSLSMVAGLGDSPIVVAQDFPDLGEEIPPSPGLDAASDLVDDPFALPIISEVEELPKPDEVRRGEGFAPPTPDGGVNWRGLEAAGIRPGGKRYQEFGVDARRAAEANPLNRPAPSGRVADFSVQKTETVETQIVRRELTDVEERLLAAALRQSDVLRDASADAFRHGELPFSQYIQSLDASLTITALSSQILDDPETLATALDERRSLLQSAGRQIAALDQPGAERWRAEVLLADVLVADTVMKSAALRRDSEQFERAEAVRSAAANRLFAQRMHDYGLGMATLQEVTQAARYLVPSTSGEMSRDERDRFDAAMAAYGELLREAEETTAAWHASKANMGTDELVSVIVNDGRLLDLDDLGPDGTGLGPDDEFADVRDYDDLTARSATRPEAIDHEDVIPTPFDTTGETAGVGRVDRLLATEAEVYGLTGQVADLHGRGHVAEDAYGQSFAANAALYGARLEMYQHGTASLGDVLEAWIGGQHVREHGAKAGFAASDNWTAAQREALSELQTLTEGRHDPRGSGTVELELLSSLGALEQLSDLQTALRADAAQRAAELAAPAPPPRAGEPAPRVQTFDVER